jgi:UDP-N-acetylglucosamine enolpyruvyl transferase
MRAGAVRMGPIGRGSKAVIHGPAQLEGATVMATDARAHRWSSRA